MRKGWVVGGALVLAFAVAVVGDAQAQWRQTDEDWCEESRDRDRDRHCMVLEASFDDFGELLLDAGMNGGVQIEGWDRDQVEVRAKVWGYAESEARARALAEDVEIRMDRGRLEADGPDTRRRESWGVSWEIMVPSETDLDVETFNGGINIAAVRGTIRFEALNGGVRLTEVAGDVVGSTTNGGVHVELDGPRWDGEELDVETTNGGIVLRVPDGFSGELDAATVNGGIDVDFPVRVQGRIGRRVVTTLGDGGPTVRAHTTNGSVKIQRGQRSLRTP